MLLTMVDVISCENPDCREFARVVSATPGAKSYYCPVCGKISYSRMVDAALCCSQKEYEAYLRAAIASETEPAVA